MNNYVIYRGETEPLNKGCIWIHHENGDLNAPLIASVYRDGVWINKLDDTSSSDVVRECCPKESEDTIIYRGEDEPSNKKCIWIHHTIPYDTTSPLIAQVYINGEWVDKTEEFSDTPYIKPIDGIPERDLSAEVQEKLNSGYTKEELDEKFEIVNNDIDNLEDTKVDKIEGKGLSTEDYTTEEKAKLNGIQSGAEVNVNADWNATSGDAEILNKPNLSVYATKASVSDIEALIPSQASTNNKLADKDFVNSSISTNTAEFQGTYSSVSDLENITDADINDYAFVISVDSSGNTVYNRYKYNGTSWIYEYSLNNSSFTAAQWAAIQSGITASLVSKLTSLPTNTELNDLLSNKVDKVSGKGLSTNDYTTAEKTKLSGIETNAQVNILEGVKVNGTDLPINNKKVDITISDIATDLGTELKENQEFVFRQTADGTLTKDYSVEYIKSIHGRTLAWNQLVNSANILNSKTIDGITITNNGDGSISISGEATSNVFFYVLLTNLSIPIGHKVCVLAPKMPSDQVHTRYAMGGNWFTEAFINITSAASTSQNIAVYIASGYTVEIKWYVNIIDLTLMFGSGNEPSTVEEFEAMFPDTYYPYNAGTLISNDAEELETVGFNQWNEEWETGDIVFASGENIPSSSWIRNKGYIPCLPNTTYYIKCQDVQTNIYFYDNDFNYLGQTTGGLLQSKQNAEFQTPDCVYMRFASKTATFTNDICINLSDHAKNGTYEPYWKRTINLGLNSFNGQYEPHGDITITGGLKSAGSVYDEIVRNKYVKRVGSVDLGTLSWGYNSGDHPSFYTNFTTKANANGLCPIYTIIPETSIASAGNMTLQMRGNLVYVVNTSYSDAATFKAAMSGVMFYYELATPIEYELAEPIMSIKTDRYGTERIYHSDTTLPCVPMKADIQYGTDSGDISDENNKLFNIISELIKRIETLENQ